MLRSLLFAGFLISMPLSLDAKNDDSVGPSPDVRLARQAVVELEAIFRGPLNKHAPLTISIDQESSETLRNVPLLEVPIPWCEQPLRIEVPEYSWAKLEGDEHNEQPFFYGRQIGMIPDWVVRYPQMEQPVWRELPAGVLTLDVPLDGGFVQHFRVVPRDRYFQVWFGMTNNSEKPMTEVWAQLCTMTWRACGLAERHPTSTCFLTKGQVASWDVAGQDLGWIESFRAQENKEEFVSSVFFTAQTLEDYWDTGKPNGLLRPDFMMLDQPVDMPAIAKTDQQAPTRNLVIYSPSARSVFFNGLVPCFHADPRVDLIAQGETRWTVSFFVLFEGNVADLFEKLYPVHQRLKVRNGYLIDDPLESDLQPDH